MLIAGHAINNIMFSEAGDTTLSGVGTDSTSTSSDGQRHDYHQRRRRGTNRSYLSTDRANVYTFGRRLTGWPAMAADFRFSIPNGRAR